MEEHSKANRDGLFETLDEEWRQFAEFCESNGGMLVLNDVRVLSEAEADLISHYRGRCVYLNGLTQLDAATAEKIGTYS